MKTQYIIPLPAEAWRQVSIVCALKEGLLATIKEKAETARYLRSHRISHDGTRAALIHMARAYRAMTQGRYFFD